jgi:hypothetical protein
MDPLSLQASQPDNRFSLPLALPHHQHSGTLSAIFLPSLISKFYSVLSSDSQPNLAAFAKSVSVGAFSLHQYAFPILECVTSVARAVGRDITPHAAGIVSTCLHLIHDVCAVYEQLQLMGDHAEELPEPPSKDFIVCALDVIGGIMEGLEQDFVTVSLLANGSEDLQVVFVQQLIRCLCDNDSGGSSCLAVSESKPSSLLCRCPTIRLLFVG